MLGHNTQEVRRHVHNHMVQDHTSAVTQRDLASRYCTINHDTLHCAMYNRTKFRKYILRVIWSIIQKLSTNENFLLFCYRCGNQLNERLTDITFRWNKLSKFDNFACLCLLSEAILYSIYTIFLGHIFLSLSISEVEILCIINFSKVNWRHMVHTLFRQCLHLRICYWRFHCSLNPSPPPPPPPTTIFTYYLNAQIAMKHRVFVMTLQLILSNMTNLYKTVSNVLPARTKEPTQEMNPERKELNGNVPTKRQYRNCTIPVNMTQVRQASTSFKR